MREIIESWEKKFWIFGKTLSIFLKSFKFRLINFLWCKDHLWIRIFPFVQILNSAICSFICKKSSTKLNYIIRLLKLFWSYIYIISKIKTFWKRRKTTRIYISPSLFYDFFFFYVDISPPKFFFYIDPRRFWKKKGRKIMKFLT